MAKGRKTGGRVKGVPNKVTTEAKEVFRLILQDMAPEAKDLSLIHISEPTRRVVISYAVFCLKK